MKTLVILIFIGSAKFALSQIITYDYQRINHLTSNSIESNDNNLNSFQQQQPLVTPFNQPSSILSQASNRNQFKIKHQTLSPIITKNYYTFQSQPDDDELELDSNDLSRQLVSPIRRNYRIVFIKAPTQSSKSVASALKLAAAQAQQKTVIYVLSKKTDLSDIQNKITQQQKQTAQQNKPQVYFIKYRTTDEAKHVQRKIQQQYDNFRGTTHISEEEISPVQSFIGALDEKSKSFAVGGSSQSAAESSSYLPPLF